MKYIKPFLSIIGFVALFLLCGMGLRYLLTDDTASYTRIMMHELYEESQNIDVLFVGSSHSFRSLDPAITDETFQKNTFIAGSSAQLLDGSLAMIKEAAAHNDLEQVYLEMYYALSLSPAVADRTDLTNVYILTDYMRPSLNRLRFLCSASTKDYYMNGFCIARRNWQKLYDWPYIATLLQKKADPSYRNYAPTAAGTAYYAKKGYVVNTGAIEDGAFYAAKRFMRFGSDSVYDGWQDTLLEIIDFCESRNIELILYSAPISMIQLVDSGNYDDYIAYVRQTIAGRDVRYYDFNLCKEPYSQMRESEYNDYDHLNQTGATRFSRVFSDFFTGQIPESELFYDSFAQKLQSIPPDVFGVLVETDAENRSLTVTPVTNAAPEDVTVHIEKAGDEASVSVTASAAEITPVSYADGESGTLEITTYLGGTRRTRLSFPFGS